jgi:monoamine oxidase
MDDRPGETELDLAIIGAGVAGMSVAYEVQRARRDWSIALYERTNRIGGRLHSVRIDGLEHPIELGGMRYVTSQPRISAVIDELRLPTHPFDPTGGAERSVLRGAVGAGADDPDAGRGYDLLPAERGRSALDLARDAFERIVPGFEGLDHDGFAQRRATARYLDRRLTDWSIGEARATVLSPGARQFVVDAFGYQSGGNAFNASDHIEFLFSGGDPSAEARTPDDGMDRIPRELAARFEASGGLVQLGHELVTIEFQSGATILTFANRRSVRAKRAVLALPKPAYRIVASASPVLRSASFERVVDAVEAFAAMKLYLWFDRPWWRPTVSGIRTSTDLPLRKIYYLDGKDGAKATLLAMYTDGLDIRPWAELDDGAAPGAPASSAMLARVQRYLRKAHPEVRDIPPPAGSALKHWGADPHEVAWHFWRAGVVSDEILRDAPQPDPTVPLYLANEMFSRQQSWAEGALEAAEAVVKRLTLH